MNGGKQVLLENTKHGSYEIYVYKNEGELDNHQIMSRPDFCSYVVHRSNNFINEYDGGDAGVYPKLASGLDIKDKTIFAIAKLNSEERGSEVAVVGGMSACIKNAGETDFTLPSIKKYFDSDHNSLVPKYDEDKHSMAEIYGVWRDKAHSGIGITENLYKAMFDALSKEKTDIVIASLTPKNVRPYIKGCDEVAKLYESYVKDDLNIVTTNSKGHEKPRIIVTSETKGLGVIEAKGKTPSSIIAEINKNNIKDKGEIIGAILGK